MFLICYLLLFLHAKRSHEITPLKRLIQRPEESLKPMKFLAEDLIAALNEELSVVGTYYDKELGEKTRNQTKDKVLRAFQESFLQRNGPSTDTRQYLILDQSIVLCDGEDIVKVEEPELSTFTHAQKTCEESQLCSYFVWKKSSETEEGVVWYCKGTGWMSSQGDRRWSVAVKPQWDTLSSYDMLPNKKLFCESSTKPFIKYGPLSLEDIDFWCKKTFCSAFTVSYGSSSKTQEMVKPHFGQKVEFCYGLDNKAARSKATRAKGWLTGIKKNQTANVNEMRHQDRRVSVQMVTGYPSNIDDLNGETIQKNGPILLNNYSWMGKAGDIIGDPIVGRTLIRNTV